jgi:hypothetical protein
VEVAAVGEGVEAAAVGEGVEAARRRGGNGGRLSPWRKWMLPVVGEGASGGRSPSGREWRPHREGVEVAEEGVEVSVLGPPPGSK